MRIVLGVGGGIAAYKVASLLRLFTEDGHDVRVVPTDAALHFVGSATWEALSGHPVSSRVWDNVDEVPHVTIGRQADLVVVAPATADLLARAAAGAANDLLTAVLLTATCPIMYAPAMHTEMWQHPATQANVALLRGRGARVLDPADGRLTGSDSGPGRMPEPDQIARAALACVRPADMSGLRVLVTAGGTREYLDPVRYLGNRSSGRQGCALAAAAHARGASVTLIAANAEVAAPLGVTTVAVETGADLRGAVDQYKADADVIVMAAAVADYAPTDIAAAKIKKSGGGLALSLVATPDILAALVAERRPGQVIVGFAAETGDTSASVLEHGRAKLATKGCDLLVVNDVTGDRAFGALDNEVTILTADSQRHVPRAPKSVIADAIWDAVLTHTRR